MFLKIEDRYNVDRIYRDARVYFIPPAAFGVLFMISALWGGIYYPEQNRDASVAFFMALFTVLFFGFIIRWMLHGSIVLDNTRGELEFSESWDLEKPNFAVRREYIDMVKMQYLSGGNTSGYMGGGGGYKLVLGIKKPHHYEHKVLNLFFSDFKDCKTAARMIGKFAGKPAYDHNGDQIFQPKLREPAVH